MSSCLSSRACGLDIDHMIKWSYNNSTNSSRTTTSNSSSPSSTLSESSNSTITTRKPRTPRKRPNQTYNEAAALLSMACPNIFSTRNLPKFSKNHSSVFRKVPELVSVFPMIENPGFLIRSQSMEKPGFLVESKVENMCQNVGEIESKCVYEECLDEGLDDFDTESILDEEIEQGIDSIMGDSTLIRQNDDNVIGFNTCYGYPIGLGFGVRNGVKALRKCGEGNWSNFPMVDVANISPPVVAKCEKVKGGKKTKKKRVDELMKSGLVLRKCDFKCADENVDLENGHGLGLKLDYHAVLNAWSDKGSPLQQENSTSSHSGGYIHARAANIDLFSKNGGWVESGDKNNISRQHVKYVSNDRRPRCKGRFVKKPGSTACEEET